MKLYELDIIEREKISNNTVNVFTASDNNAYTIGLLEDFFENNTNIKCFTDTTVTSRHAISHLKVFPQDYYISSIIGSKFIKDKNLENIHLNTPDGNYSSSISSILTNTSHINIDEYLSILPKDDNRQQDDDLTL